MTRDLVIGNLHRYMGIAWYGMELGVRKIVV